MPLIKSSNILVEHWLNVARNKNTPSEQFRVAMENIGSLLFSEAINNTDDLVHKLEIKTPLKRTKACLLEQKHIVLVPILRAGLSMLPGIRRMVPQSKVAHVGLFRHEKTLQPHWYLDKLPKKITRHSAFFILEPMIATGGTITTVLQRIIILGAKKINVISALMAKQAAQKLEAKFAPVNFYTASIDPALNSKGFIVPGLGDAGDRAFNL